MDNCRMVLANLKQVAQKRKVRTKRMIKEK